LNNAFLAAFEKVPEWQDAGFEKPKFHPALHLSQSLDEFGPLRGFWCMSFEGYLKLLKPVFKMSNWKDAPTTVASHWITKAVMHWRDPLRGSWYTNHVVSPTTEFSTDIEALAKKSQMIALIKQELHSARSLKKVVRGPDELQCGNWIIIRRPGTPALACHVKSIMEIVPRGGHFSVIRLWCAGVEICDDPVSGAISADVNEIPRHKIVPFESVHIQVVSRVLTDTCIEFH